MKFFTEEDTEFGQPFVKIMLFGDPGTGKTYSSSLLAASLAKSGGGRVAFIDSEYGGADFVQGIYSDTGCKLYGRKTKTFKHLLAAMEDASEFDVIIIDSLSNFYPELMAAYLSSKGKAEMSFRDWGPFKSQWKRFTDAFLSAQCHCIVCAREAKVYATRMVNGKLELEVVGYKPKDVGDFAYEPSLVIRMHNDPEAKKNQVAGVWKDRSGKMVDNGTERPTPEYFQPFIDSLRAGGKDFSKETSEELFAADNIIEEIGATWKDFAIGDSKADKERKLALLKKFFGSVSSREIKKIDPMGARECLERLRVELENNIGG